MTIDIAKARALASDLQCGRLFQQRLAGDIIAALLDEVEGLASIVNSPIVHEERNKLEGEIEALKAERDNLRRSLDEHIRAADSKIDALARDAARYRWLRANEDGVSYCVTHDGNTGATVYMAGDELDAAIDAAMGEKNGR